MLMVVALVPTQTLDLEDIIVSPNPSTVSFLHSEVREPEGNVDRVFEWDDTVRVEHQSGTGCFVDLVIDEESPQRICEVSNCIPDIQDSPLGGN